MNIKKRLQDHRNNQKVYGDEHSYQYSASGCLFHSYDELLNFTNEDDDFVTDNSV